MINKHIHNIPKFLYPSWSSRYRYIICSTKSRKDIRNRKLHTHTRKIQSVERRGEANKCHFVSTKKKKKLYDTCFGFSIDFPCPHSQIVLWIYLSVYTAQWICRIHEYMCQDNTGRITCICEHSKFLFIYFWKTLNSPAFLFKTLTCIEFFF